MDKLVEVKGLSKHFPVQSGMFGKSVGKVKAVDGVSFDILRGETLGLVGESGCGKSTTGRLILNLINPTAGEVLFEGKSVYSLNGQGMRNLRRDMQIVFQDPYASLNPRMKIGEIIEEPMVVHGIGDRQERAKKVKKLLELVGLSDYHAIRYPHEFSGGQRQRVGIARALSVNPKLVICDEPVSALDVSIQSQVLNLLKDLQKEFGLTYLFIAHGLNVVKHMSDRVGVMYLGKLVEVAEGEYLYSNPLHPYTKALLSAIPVHDPKLKKERIVLTGDVPSPVNPPQGCRFHPRCWLCQDLCKEKEPQLEIVAPGRAVACHFAEKVSN